MATNSGGSKRKASNMKNRKAVLTEFSSRVDIDGILLNKISPDDTQTLKTLFKNCGARAWCCFTPFLFHTSNPSGNHIFWTEISATPAILYRRVRGEKISWDLYTLCTDSIESTRDTLKLLHQLNNGDTGRIMWLPEDSAGFLRDMGGFHFQPRDSEYFYDTQTVAKMEGNSFRELRKKVNRFRREYPKVSIEQMTQKDAPECIALLSNWKTTFSSRGYAHPLVDHFYTVSCIENFSLFSSPDIFGWVTRMNKNIVGFSIAGEMYSGLANFFALKCNLDMRGLSTYLRYHSISEMAKMGFSRINDASDLNVPGLARHKNLFNPVEKLNIFSATRI